MARGSLSHAMLESFAGEFKASPMYRAAMNSVCRNDVQEVILQRENVVGLKDQSFNNRMKYKEAKVTSQKASGRCWLFAALNAIRLPFMEKHNLESFEFSQTYLFFWDKFEKSNYFLESMIQLSDRKEGDRVIDYLLQAPINDGGQYDMFLAIVDKYGLVPKSVYPESHHSGNSRKLNWLITFKLREGAQVLRKMKQDNASDADVQSVKSNMLSEVYRILCIFLGEPPSSFDWRFTDKDKKHVSHEKQTPLGFVKDHVPFQFDSKVSLINDPRNEYYQLYTVDFLGNVVGGKPVRYINVPIEDLKKYAATTIKSGEPVWFGCDVGKFFHRKLHAMDLELLDYKLHFGVDFAQNKKDRLVYGQSLMTHAMMFNAFDGTVEKPTRWRVENSWGDANNKGFATMTDAWFNEYMYQIVVDKSILPDKITAVLEQKPHVLPAWDPMGALAE